MGLLYLRGDEAFECKAIAGVGVTEASRLFKGRPIRAGRGTAAERVILTGEVQSITNFYEDPEMDPRIREAIRNANGSDSSIGQIRSTLAVPMTRDNAVIGVMVIGCSQTGSFPQRQIELLQTFADQAVIAIENARLFDEVQAKTADLSESLQHQTATSEVLKVISRSPGELDPVFRTILSSATSICDAQFGLLVLYEGGGFRCASMFNLPPAFAETFSRNPVIYPPPIDPLGRLIATQQLVHVVDVKQEPAYLTDFPPIVELVELGGARTLLLVPMLKENNLVGVIAIFRQTVHAFSDKQIDLVTSFGSQAVIAIENARLLNELRERTDDLTESLQQQTATADVLKVISRSAFDLKSVLTTLTESAKSLCGASLGIICLRDGEVMRLQAESGCTQAFVDFMHAHPIKPGRETITGRVFMDGKPVHVADVELDPEYNFANAPTIGAYRAVLAVPLMRDAAVEGVLLLGRPGPGPFSQRQLDLVQTFADQAVIAIENVRLFEQVQERTKELSLSLDELRTAQDRLVQTEKLASLGQLTAGIAHEIKNPLNFVNNFSALSGELIDELNELLGSATLDDKAREEIDELTQYAQGQPREGGAARQARRLDRQEHAAAFARGVGRTSARRYQCDRRGKPQSGLSWRAGGEIRPSISRCKRDLDPAAGIDRPLPAGDHAGVSQSHFERLLRRHQAQGSRRRRASSRRLSATTKNLGNRVEIRIRDNGTGIPAGSEGEDVQSLLHHQARGRRHRTWPVDEPRHRRETARRQDRGRNRTWCIHRIHHYAAANAAAQTQAGGTKLSVYILVVDDEPDVEALFRQQFRRDLKSGRFKMEFAPSALEALVRAAEIKDPSLILILSDINMPGMSGLEMLPKVRAERPDVPVIMITAYGDAETRRKAIERGAVGLLTKPIDFALLRLEIDARLGQAA